MKQLLPSTTTHYWRRGLLLALFTFICALLLRMLEWPNWQNGEFRLGHEFLLATHDAYHWVAGAEGFGLAVGHPMAHMLEILSDLLHIPPAAVAFWFPLVLSSLVAVIVYFWVWALGSMEAGVAAGLITSFSPGFLARTLLGFYDTDLITLFFPLLMTLFPATWAMRHLLLPAVVMKKLLGKGFSQTSLPSDDELIPQGNPLAMKWIFLLGLSGLISWQTQSWHSVFPYLIRYNVALLACMAFFLAPKNRRGLLLLGALTYALPCLAGPAGLVFSILVFAGSSVKSRVILRFLLHPAVQGALWIITTYFLVNGGIAETVIAHLNAYIKHSADIREGTSGISLLYPSVAQSIVEIQDLNIPTILSYFHPWPEAAFLGLFGFLLVMARRPGALFLLPLSVLAFLSIKLGGRMVMFGAPIMGIGLSLPLYWLFQKTLKQRLRGTTAGTITSVLLSLILLLPFLDIIPAMSQGPMINRRHAECLRAAGDMTPVDSKLWIWWDWGYATHHFAKRSTIADGAEHAGPSLYLPAAVFATDNPRFARQLMRYTQQKGDVAGNVFQNLDAAGAEELMNRLRSAQTPLIESKGRIFIIVSFEMLRLGFWISNFGSWNFITQKGEGGALSIVPQELSYKLDTGEVRLGENEQGINAAAISIFDETGLTHRNYVQEWFAENTRASKEEQKQFLEKRRNVHFLFNKVTDEKIAIDERISRSLMVRLLIAPSQDPLLSPYFKLIYDNVFARIYEVL
ncbi:MAG: hypothetical protein K5657_04095 [Desulfovibrio sp.]|nr:hypothetical protein [Desulfovibrio sp.]